MADDFLKPVHDWYSRRKMRRGQKLLGLEDTRAVDSYIRWSDHGLFRELWTNLYEIAPGVWRSNHPPSGRFKALKHLGIRTILSLRAEDHTVPHRREVQLCQAHDITLEGVNLNARRAPDAAPLVRALDVLRTAERPVLFHCKSGADRAGLVAALYLLEVEGKSPDDARAMLSRKYLHYKGTRTGILDAFLEAFIAAKEATGVRFEDWVTTQYDPLSLQGEFDTSRA
ncbi:tyrosine-protein phosphatase [Pseudooceanicola sp. MF1-13]|uniref:tyrosine-protein phosphatase n=1 Tax=Pseudooceanicola sp. MF1-13 TaxID=3379095 RepID=UPI003891947D